MVRKLMGIVEKIHLRKMHVSSHSFENRNEDMRVGRKEREKKKEKFLHQVGGMESNSKTNYVPNVQ